MSPVLNYGRSDRYDRAIPKERSGSPNSNESSSSNGSGSGAVRGNGFGTTGQLINFITTRTRHDSEPNIGNGHQRPAVADDPMRRHSVPRTIGSDEYVAPKSSTPIDINDFCMGKPKKVGQSHTGTVELYVSLQEDALFLPTVKSRSRREYRHQRSHHPPASSSGSGSGSASGSGPASAAHPMMNDLYSSSLPMEFRHGDYADEGAHDEDEGSDEDAADPAGPDSHRSHHPRGPTEATPGHAEPASAPGEPASIPPTVPDSSERQLPAYNSTIHEDETATASSCATLRGSVLLKLTKPTKIKEIGVSFFCMSSTLWNLLPQSSLLIDHTGHNNAQVEDTAYLGIHHWDFVPLEQFGPAQTGYDKVCGNQSGTLIGQDLYGADVAVFKDHPHTLQQRKFTRLTNSSAARVRKQDSYNVPVFGPLKSQPRKLKQTSVHADGVMFPAGSYVYNFTLLVDAKTPGSACLSNGQVKFALAAKVFRAGAFTLNVSGSLGVEVVHVPQDFTEGEYSGPQNDQVLLSRIWENMFMYYINLERRSITLDVPTKLSITLMPLVDWNVRVHQIQVFINETATYVYSMDSSIKYVDPSLKLLLAQKTAKNHGGGSHESNLMDLSEPRVVDFDFTLASEQNRNLRGVHSQPYMRGRFGELRFLAPDVKGPYLRVKHRLQIVFCVSRAHPGSSSQRSHYEVKFETRVHVLSRHCVPASISLPSYTATPAEASPPPALNQETFPAEDLPSFADAMEHPLLGPSGRLTANSRGSKADFQPVSH